jgi:hypothetical protein
MIPEAREVRLRRNDRKVLEARFRSPVTLQHDLKRARIVLLNGHTIDDCTKWWGPDRHIVIYYVKPDRSEVYFVTSQPEPGFILESWSAMGDVGELREAFEGFHPQVQAVLNACPSVHKWALVDRDPLPRWGEGNIALLGDACHPMTPYMAQGAAMAIEDAAVISRCVRGWTAAVLPTPSVVSRPPESRVPRACSLVRAPIPGSGIRPIRTGSMATTPGRRRSRPHSRRPYEARPAHQLGVRVLLDASAAATAFVSHAECAIRPLAPT